jgi:hypothetical protein
MVKGRTYEFRVKTRTGNWVGRQDVCWMCLSPRDALWISTPADSGTMGRRKIILGVGDQVACVGYTPDGRVPIIRTQDGSEFKIFYGEEKYFKWVR